MRRPNSDPHRIVEFLIAAWTEALGAQVTRDSGFLELGGTSLPAIAIADSITERYGDCDGIELHALRTGLRMSKPAGHGR